jgi:hypothetical protein
LGGDGGDDILEAGRTGDQRAAVVKLLATMVLMGVNRALDCE